MNNLKPSTGSFYAGMLRGDMDAGINTISSAANLIKFIDSCKEIVTTQIAINCKEKGA